MKKGIKIFVYGSLMKGMRNNHLLYDSDFIGEGKTNPEYDMIDMGLFPAITFGGSLQIKGEVYQVENWILKAIDRLEGHPFFYKRSPIKLENGETVETYILNDDTVHEQKKLKSGDWRQQCKKTIWRKNDTRL